MLVSKSRSLQNRGPFIQYYVDEDHDLAIHNVVCTDRDFARTAILRLGGWVSKSRSDTHMQKLSTSCMNPLKLARGMIVKTEHEGKMYQTNHVSKVGPSSLYCVVDLVIVRWHRFLPIRPARPWLLLWHPLDDGRVSKGRSQCMGTG